MRNYLRVSECRAALVKIDLSPERRKSLSVDGSFKYSGRRPSKIVALIQVIVLQLSFICDVVKTIICLAWLNALPANSGV